MQIHRSVEHVIRAFKSAPAAAPVAPAAATPSRAAAQPGPPAGDYGSYGGAAGGYGGTYGAGAAQAAQYQSWAAASAGAYTAAAHGYSSWQTAAQVLLRPGVKEGRLCVQKLDLCPVRAACGVLLQLAQRGADAFVLSCWLRGMACGRASKLGAGLLCE